MRRFLLGYRAEVGKLGMAERCLSECRDRTRGSAGRLREPCAAVIVGLDGSSESV